VSNLRGLPTAKLRVGLNAHLLSLDANYRGAGISHYIYNLLVHLPQAAADLSYLVYVGDGRARFPGWDARVSAWSTTRPSARVLWEQVVQPWSAWREKLNLLHAPAYVGPLVSPCPLVVTILDLSFYLYPEMLRPFNRVYLQRMTRRSVQQAAGVIAISRSSRDDLVRTLGVSADKIAVIPLGVDAEMHPQSDPSARIVFRRDHRLPERMILFLGTLEPRKNIVALLEAYALLRREYDIPQRLVIAGGKGWYYQQIDATVERLRLRDEVFFPGFVPQQELPFWYDAAELFVYPSLYEGFGLPPLEAMACGTPVVVGDAAAVAEVVGDAGVIANPRDPQALAASMLQVLSDPVLQRALRAMGLKRAQEFSWHETARQTARFYQRILGEQPDDER
jgi:glycosyltransferase involved in cell wall biosynthesis